MRDWDPRPPAESDLGDHEVRLDGTHLSSRRIAVVVTGGIAAYKIPGVVRALRRQGATVQVFVTAEAQRYVAIEALAWCSNSAVISALSPAAEHLSDSAPFDAVLVAPATYNTINKCASGVADTPITALLASALGRMERGKCAVLIAPTMHGSMHTSILSENLRRLKTMGVRLIAPRDEGGKHNLPDEGVLVAEVCRALSTSALRGKRILLTGGPVPAQLDDVRQITNKFSGALSVCLARELLLRGAEVEFILGAATAPVPSWMAHTRVTDITDYRQCVLDRLARRPCDAAIMSAGVADFAPARASAGKRPSDSEWNLTLQPTPKVIDEIHAAHPTLPIVAFKFTHGSTREELLAVARERAERYGAVLANRGEDITATTHGAWLVTRDAAPRPLDGKEAVAAGICDHLEAVIPVESGAADARR